jgi:hypothetical protein
MGSITFDALAGELISTRRFRLPLFAKPADIEKAVLFLPTPPF